MNYKNQPLFVDVDNVCCVLRTGQTILSLEVSVSPPALPNGITTVYGNCGLLIEGRAKGTDKISSTRRHSVADEGLKKSNPFFSQRDAARFMPLPQPPGDPIRGLGHSGDPSPECRHLPIRHPRDSLRVCWGRQGEGWILKCQRFFNDSQRAPLPTEPSNHDSKRFPKQTDNCQMAAKQTDSWTEGWMG